MRIWACSILILLLASCNKADNLIHVCRHECYTGPKGTEDVGACKSGMTVCGSDGLEMKDEFGKELCIGEIVPSSEMCDGIDNNCDRRTDELVIHSSFLYSHDVDYPCLTLGECRTSRAKCASGSWICEYDGAVELPDETRCDNKDNDCDGIIDDNIFENMELSERICYSGNPTETLAIPPCRAGLQQCIRGEVICLNEIIPGQELCDRIDNDCNGIVDDTGTTLSTQYDIVFIVDTSGSMCDEISAVAGACSAYAQQFDGNPNFKFALVIMSSRFGSYVQVELDFSDFSSIRNRLLTLGCSGNYAEASMDSMHNVCDKDSNLLNLSWRDSANSLFFMFTDENQQTYTTPPTTGQDVIDACVLSGTLPFIWSVYPADFAYIANGANGAHFTLVNNWQQIFDNMNSVVITLCGAGG